MNNISELYSNKVKGKELIKISSVQLVNFIEDKEILDFSNDTRDSILTGNIIENLLISDMREDVLEFNKACSAYLKVEHFVDVDYKSEIVACNGVKEALRCIPLAFINKDDYIITTSPGCKVMSNMGEFLGCHIYEYQLNKFNNYLIDFEDIEESILKRCKILYINYPNNPTGAIASKEFFKEVIKYAKKYNFIVVNDATYIDLCLEDIDKLSFLSVEGAKDVGIEIYSFSQTFNMSSYKIGFIAGNKDIIKAYREICNSLDIKIVELFKHIGIILLKNHEKITRENKEKYLRRYSLFKESLEKFGFKVTIPKAAPYLYIEIPKSCNGVGFEKAYEFSLWLKENENIIVSPYDNEENYVRLSLNFKGNREDDNEIIKKVEERLKKYKFECK